jgi:hypothetical protein
MQVSTTVSHICAIISNCVRANHTRRNLPKRGLLALCGEPVDYTFPKFEALRVRAELNDFGDLITRVTIRLHD